MSELKEKIIKDHGFYDENGNWNGIITFPGDDKIYRHRVETIVVKNDKEVFYKSKPNGEYFLPGGSVEKGIPNIQQAINEVHEETFMNIKNVKYSGLTYTKLIDKHTSKHLINWDGLYTEIYVADYDSKFKGEVNDVDKDSFIKSGNFYSLKQAFKIFRKEHREALLKFLKSKDEPEEESSEVTEGYISNYFANKRLLRKIGKNPEIGRDTVKEVIKQVTDKYNSLKNTSNVKRLIKNKDDCDLTWFPVVDFEFPDNSTVTVALNFTQGEQVSPGFATHSDEYGDVICLAPTFFKLKDIEEQIFIILHELGHIRLNHVADKNMKILGVSMDPDKHRIRAMGKDKVVYPELNADLYAMLNGANLYSIMNLSYDKDKDGEYDYRFTNAELANRYSNVWKKYRKISKYYEKDEEDSLSTYDIYCMALYEMVYENNILMYLSEGSKYDLYNLLYQFAIPKNNDEIIIERATVGESDFYGKNNRVTKIFLEKNQARNLILEKAIEIHDKLAYEYITNGKDYVKYCYLIESLTKAERDQIDIDDFGIKSEKKYPLDTKEHTISAIKLFGHCSKANEKELAHNIIKAMNKFGIDKSMVGKDSRLFKYI